MLLKRRMQSTDTREGQQMWLTTFNDMVTLLMVFFVLLFSMGSLDVKRFKHFQNALQSAMGIMNAGHHAPIGTPTDSQPNSDSHASHSKQNQHSDEGISELDETQGLQAEYTKKGIRLTLNDELLFRSGSAVLTGPGKALLNKISSIVKPLKRRIRVEGHTDNVPIRTEQYPSNWELSTERAINVVKVLIQEGGIAPAYLSAVGYADVKPKHDNKLKTKRRKNRRVEIILGKVQEPLMEK